MSEQRIAEQAARTAETLRKGLGIKLPDEDWQYIFGNIEAALREAVSEHCTCRFPPGFFVKPYGVPPDECAFHKEQREAVREAYEDAARDVQKLYEGDYARGRREAVKEERKALREVVRTEYFSGAELVRARILAALDARDAEEGK